VSYREHNIPLYKQILIDLKKKLKNGVWNIGDLFPSEKELMENYNVSSITIRRVLLELVNDGWIERRHGIGTFVKKEYVEPLEKLVGFFEQIYAKGRTPRAKMLFNGVVSLQEELLNEVPELQELNSDRIYSIIKTHFIDDKPVEYVCSYWSEEIGKKLINYDLETKGVYEILK
jgi:GntR family transcriptional regulator